MDNKISKVECYFSTQRRGGAEIFLRKIKKTLRLSVSALKNILAKANSSQLDF